MKRPHELLPDSPIVDLDTAYEIVAHILQSPEQARRDFLAHGRGDRLPRLRWFKAVDSWVNDDEELSADFLKRCELVEDGRHLYVAVRGAVKPDSPHTTIEVNGEILLVLDDFFGLSRDNLIQIYPVLAQSRSQPKRADDPDFRKQHPRPWLVVLTLDAIEDQGDALVGVPKKELAERLKKKLGVPISLKTLQRAEAYRRDHPGKF